MLFNSFSFLIFFPIVTIVYFVLPHRFRWFWLLLASSYFYMSFVPIYIVILAFTIAVDYGASLIIEHTENKKRKKALLIISLLANIGILSIFKYANFGISNINALAQIINWNYSINLLTILLPIGLSFHTFQSLSYVIEVYRGNQKAEKNLGIFALYVMFYPQLVAGPIERPQHLLHQFREKHDLDYEKIVSGLKLMAVGFFKKMVVADRLAEFVNPVYNNAHSYSGWPLIITTIFFAFQIYYDFSGYSDIARGAAKVMGFDLMVNFNNPYKSKTIAEFWKRWHISLSSWFKDYVYIPLGGSRVNKLRSSFNIMAVFLLSGLWHGANWTYILWGGLNGLYLVTARFTENIRTKLAHLLFKDGWKTTQNFMQIGTAFMLICFSWILFRAQSVSDAWYIFKNLLADKNLLTGLIDPAYIKQHIMLGRGFLNFTVVIVFIFLIEWAHIYAEKKNIPIEQALENKKWYYRWPVYYFLIIAIVVFGILSPTNFIYFQF